MADQLIKRGERGDDVKALQQKLAQLGYAVAADGVYGPATQDAVEDLQATFGYNVDGIVGPATLRLIEAQIGYGFKADDPQAIKKGLQSQGKTTDKGSLAGAALTRTLKRGMDGADVRYLQRRLRALGLEVQVDGKFGSTTEDAVKRLQQAFGYDVDGIVGEGTHTLINAQIGFGWNPQSATSQPQANSRPNS